MAVDIKRIRKENRELKDEIQELKTVNNSLKRQLLETFQARVILGDLKGILSKIEKIELI